MLQPSPLETLASYAISFVAGALVAVGIAAYGRYVRAQAGGAS